MARRLSRDDIISNVYYNLKTGFGSINETLKESEGTRPDHQQGGCGKLHEETTQQTD